MIWMDDELACTEQTILMIAMKSIRFIFLFFCFGCKVSMFLDTYDEKYI